MAIAGTWVVSIAMIDLRRFPDSQSLARGAAEYFVSTVNQTLDTQSRCSVALSGGSTPKAMFQLLASNEFSSRLDWKKIHIFWVDERSVPPDHVDSNYRMTKEFLLDHAPIPLDNVHRILAELNPKEAAQIYEETLATWFGRDSAVPEFDLILLGMGDDGHTASLFPHTAALAETDRWVVANNVPKLDTWRITLTVPVINSATNIAFLISGESKAQTLHNVLEGEYAPQDFPSQRIQPERGHLVWLVDNAAASLLTT
jgi:6-phosphogluconolactonase